jgi:hypothetical protein
MKTRIPALLLLLLSALSPALAQVGPEQGPGGDGSLGNGMAAMQDHSVRGDITAISGSNITVKSDEGGLYTVETGPNTRFRRQRDFIQITDLHPGDMIAAIGDKDAKAKTLGAMFVMVIDRAQYEKARADFGKTWTAGTVKSIDGTDIVVERPDHVTQTISVDENTSFRKRRDSITLADIHPGDQISARGAVRDSRKDSAFLATTLTVLPPRGAFGGPHSGTRGATPSGPNGTPQPASSGTPMTDEPATPAGPQN